MFERIATRCNCCGKMVFSFSDRSEWFGKYLKPGEERICRKCIRSRDGYAEEFLEVTGMSIGDLDGTGY